MSSPLWSRSKGKGRGKGRKTNLRIKWLDEFFKLITTTYASPPLLSLSSIWDHFFLQKTLLLQQCLLSSFCSVLFLPCSATYFKGPEDPSLSTLLLLEQCLSKRANLIFKKEGGRQLLENKSKLIKKTSILHLSGRIRQRQLGSSIPLLHGKR